MHEEIDALRFPAGRFRFRCRECPFAGREGLWLTEMRLRVAQALGVGQARVRVGLVWHSETHNADLVVTRSRKTGVPKVFHTFLQVF